MSILRYQGYPVLSHGDDIKIGLRFVAFPRLRPPLTGSARPGPSGPGRAEKLTRYCGGGVVLWDPDDGLPGLWSLISTATAIHQANPT
jgi:hypothetical protein